MKVVLNSTWVEQGGVKRNRWLLGTVNIQRDRSGTHEYKSEMKPRQRRSIGSISYYVDSTLCIAHVSEEDLATTRHQSYA